MKLFPVVHMQRDAMCTFVVCNTQKLVFMYLQMKSIAILTSRGDQYPQTLDHSKSSKSLRGREPLLIEIINRLLNYLLIQVMKKSVI